MPFLEDVKRNSNDYNGLSLCFEKKIKVEFFAVADYGDGVDDDDDDDDNDGDGDDEDNDDKV